MFMKRSPQRSEISSDPVPVRESRRRCVASLKEAQLAEIGDGIGVGDFLHLI